MLFSIVLHLQLFVLPFFTRLISSETLIVYFSKKLIGKVTIVRDALCRGNGSRLQEQRLVNEIRKEVLDLGSERFRNYRLLYSGMLCRVLS